MFLVRLCTDFVLGFVLGKFLDSLGKLAEELAKNNENQIRGLGARRSSRKHTQSRPESSKN